MDDKEPENSPADPDVLKRYDEARAIFESGGDMSRAIELFGELAAEGKRSPLRLRPI